MPSPPLRDLARLLADMAPRLDPASWVFCQTAADRPPPGVVPLATFREAEGLTLILEAETARALGLAPSLRASRITLSVPSDLEAVGFMARISAALAARWIPCNVMAGTSHDHLFVPEALAMEALTVLEELSRVPGQRYRQVDVFSGRAYAGNGLAVFPDAGQLTAPQMLAIAGELKQFESIYLDRDEDRNRVRARIFTVEEELAFAGHPVLGAAAVLHDETPGAGDRADWTFALSGREVSVTTRRTGQAISASMDQGIAAFGPPLDPTEAAPFLAALGLDARTAHPRLPLQMVSTGLPYLIVPLAGDLGVARIQAPGFGALLATAGAKFVYVLDPDRREGRTWDNQGLAEDVATGSAAGPAGAYLVRHGLAGEGDSIRISQGARAGRPSELRVTVRQEGNGLRVTVAGEVVLIGAGLLSILPPP